VQQYLLDKIDEFRNYFGIKIEQLAQRIDSIQTRLDDLSEKYLEIKIILTSVYNQKQIIDDLIIRIQKLEKKAS
jgi:hypothetical protein